MTPANRNAEKYLQQVCSLGLRWQEVMPTIMDTLHHIVPSYGNCFFAANQQGDVVDIFDERPEAQSVTALYAEHFLNRKEKEVFIGWRNAGTFRSAVDFDRLLKVDRRQFMRHELYNEVLKPIGYYYGAHVVLRAGSELRGYLQVERGRKSGRYTAAELRRLDRAGAFIQYALGPAPVVDDDLLYSPDVNQQGMIVAHRTGRIQHESKTARQPLHLSCFSRVSV